MTGPHWAGDKHGLNLLISISYSLLSQGASEELECDSWKGSHSQFYPLAQDEINTLTWSMAQATRWGSLSTGAWSFKAQKLRDGQSPRTPARTLFLWMVLFLPSEDSLHSESSFMPQSGQPDLWEGCTLPATLCPYDTCGDLSENGSHTLICLNADSQLWTI